MLLKKRYYIPTLIRVYLKACANSSEQGQTPTNTASESDPNGDQFQSSVTFSNHLRAGCLLNTFHNWHVWPF